MKRPDWLDKAIKWFLIKGLDTAAKLLWGAIITALLTAIVSVILYLQGAPQKWLYAGSGAFSALILVILTTVILNIVLKGESAKPATTVSSIAAEKEPCPDKWLHQIADNDKRFIEQYVKIEKCEIVGHDFLHKAPYVDFKITILNASVYVIYIEGPVKGDIRFDSQLLSKDMKVIENPARYIEHGKANYFIVRQWLSKEEVDCILSAAEDYDEFRFTGMEIMIKCRFPETDMEPKRLDVFGLMLSSKPLRDLHKRLDISIQHAGYRGHWNLAENWRRLLVNLQVSIVNTRTAPIAIHDFKLSAKIKNTNYEASAEDGEIHERRKLTEQGEERFEGQLLTNLNPDGSSFLRIAPNDNREGWLQFVLIPSPLDIEDGEIPATLTFTDSDGETHSAECRLTYTR